MLQTTETQRGTDGDLELLRVLPKKPLSGAEGGAKDLLGTAFPGGGQAMRRVTVAELRDRIDGLALAFFASMSALCSALIEVHPDDTDVVDIMRNEALAMLASLDELDQDVFPPEAVGQSVVAVFAAFVTRADEIAGEPSNDNE